ncbi:MAG: hypothetical protein WD844_03005 [Thermoleophilaceae bacterium]
MTVTVPPDGPTIAVTLRSPLVESLVGGDDQVLDAAEDVICGPFTEIAAAVPPAGILGTAGCAIGALDYQYVTRLKTGGGEIVRKHVAVVNVPTLLNVDDDPLPDVIGTLFVTSLDRFELRIDRVLTEVAPLPLRVEAIVDDPTNGALPRERINVGYDTRESMAPVLWRAVATLPDDGSAGLTTLEVDQEVVGAGATLTTLGGLFNGDALDRQDPIGGRLRYTPVPPTSDIGLTLGDHLEVRAGSSIPTLVNAVAEIVEGPREQEIKADITGLPQSLRVRYEEPGADQRTVTYEAATGVPALDASYTDRTGGTLTSKAVAHATGLPTGMVVRQTGAKSGDFVATGGTLGSVEVGYANGEPVLMNVDHPYARVVQDGVLSSYAGRIDALQSASVDATDDITAELQLGLDGRKPFRALVEQATGGRTIDGRVSDLPRHLTVQYDPDNGRVDYDGFGETIQQIDVTAEQTAPFFGRVTKIDGTIKTLPPQATVNFKPDGAGMKLETNQPIGEAEVLLTSGPDSSLPAGTFGAKVEDLPDRFTAFGRVSGLRLVDVTTTAAGAVTGHVKLASTPLKLIYEKPGSRVDASLSAIPSDVTVAFDPAAGRVDYDANAGIDRVDAVVTSDAPLFGDVKRIQARIDGLPSNVSVGFKPASGSGIEVAATPGVDMIEAALTDGRDVFPVLAEGKSGAILRDVPDEFSAFVRLFNVQAVKFVSAGNTLTANLKAGPVDGNLQDIDLDATIDVPGDAVTGPMHIAGFVQDLPSDLTIEQNGSEITYAANSVVPKVTLDATGLPGGTSGGSLDGDLHNVKGTLIDVPTGFTIVNNSLNTGVTANGPFTQVDVEAWDHGPELGAFPDDGRNKVTLQTRDGRLHVKARAFGLKKVLLGMLTSTKVETEFGSAPAPLDVAVDGGTAGEPLDLDVDVEELPISSTFELDTLLGTQIKWNAPTAGTDVGLTLSAKDVGAVLDLPNLPQTVDVCVGGGLIGCNPAAPSQFVSGGDQWLFPNAFTAVTSASDTITMNGKVCLPPTDDDGEALDPPGTVYGTCIDGTSPNRIEITNLRLKNQRLEFASGDTTNEDEDGDPIEDDLLKLYLQGDNGGIKVDNLFVRNDTSDSTTIVKAGHTGGPPLRNSGDHFFLLADMSGIPNTEIRENQIECDDLEVKVDLPALGLTDVLPSPGELVLGDVCID